MCDAIPADKQVSQSVQGEQRWRHCRQTVSGQVEIAQRHSHRPEILGQIVVADPIVPQVQMRQTSQFCHGLLQLANLVVAQVEQGQVSHLAQGGRQLSQVVVEQQHPLCLV